jgi:desulfoferrodoxin (superoxide reductase-like protein)
MSKHSAGIMMVVIALVIGLSTGVSLADKSAVTIEAPDQAAKGTEVVVKLHVTHSANSFFHYTNWVQVKVNSKDTALWEYSMTNSPEGAKFTKEVKLVVSEPLEIVAEANCNLHGSQGPVKKKITLKELR